MYKGIGWHLGELLRDEVGAMAHDGERDKSGGG